MQGAVSGCSDSRLNSCPAFCHQALSPGTCLWFGAGGLELLLLVAPDLLGRESHVGMDHPHLI